MGCLLGKLAAAPLFFPSAAAATAAGAGGDGQTQLGAPRPEHIAAVKKDESGWPLWLSSVAGDALRGWAPRSADAFQKLEKVSKQGSSLVASLILCCCCCCCLPPAA